MARHRSFPFLPASAASLEEGDVIAVRRSDGRWGALHVVGLRRSGAASRSSLVVGVLPWRGEKPPTAEDVRGRAVVRQGSTHTDLFRHGRCEVTAHTPVVPTTLPHPFRDRGVIGIATESWGWRAAVRLVDEWQPGGHLHVDPEGAPGTAPSV